MATQHAQNILAYLWFAALHKGKDLVIEDTANYGLMHLCWKHLSLNSRYYIRDNNSVAEWSFEKLTEVLSKDRIIVDISFPRS